jgi:hypothetical protein
MTQIVLGREPTQRELIASAMVGLIASIDDLELGEVARVKDTGEWFCGQVDLDED